MGITCKVPLHLCALDLCPHFKVFQSKDWESFLNGFQKALQNHGVHKTKGGSVRVEKLKRDFTCF